MIIETGNDYIAALKGNQPGLFKDVKTNFIIDAMGTQKSIAQKIIAADSDYILSLKDNHPTLHQQVKNWFEIAQSNGFKGVDVSMSQRIEKGHHRIENRQVYTVPVSQLSALHEQDLWAGLTTVVMVVRSIQHWNQTTQEVQFYITSHGARC